MPRHIKKGDVVVVVAGNDKGKTGEVLRVDAAAGKVVVQGVARVFRHLRPSRKHPQGGRIQKEMPISISNVMPVDPKTNLPTRVGFRTQQDGSKERYARKSGQSLGTLRKAR
jgi:large subunit ribosomal protein L24